MEYKTIAIKISYLLYENIVLKCNQQKCFLCEGDGQVYPSQGKRELTQNAPPAGASNTSASTISAVSNAEETEKTTLSPEKRNSN